MHLNTGNNKDLPIRVSRVRGEEEEPVFLPKHSRALGQDRVDSVESVFPAPHRPSDSLADLDSDWQIHKSRLLPPTRKERVDSDDGKTYI